MHLRRALLLFAIVLGLAALVTSVSRPSRENSRSDRSSAPEAPRAAPGPGFGDRADLHLPRARGGRAVALRSGEAATLLVSVPEPGEVEVPSLGLVSAADSLTPARLELLGGDPGTHRVWFLPAGDDEPQRYGRIVVR